MCEGGWPHTWGASRAYSAGVSPVCIVRCSHVCRLGTDIVEVHTGGRIDIGFLKSTNAPVWPCIWGAYWEPSWVPYYEGVHGHTWRGLGADRVCAGAQCRVNIVMCVISGVVGMGASAQSMGFLEVS